MQQKPMGRSDVGIASTRPVSVRRPLDKLSLRATATEQNEAEAGDLPRRVAVGGALAAFALVAVKKYGVDGNMSPLVLQPGSLKGRTIVITGGNTGLGKESATSLARAGATVVFTSRSDERGKRALDEVRRASGSEDVHYLPLDLADLSSVKAFRAAFESQPYGDHIDVLMNNAGVMAVPDRRETKDGFELQLGTNHLGHFALVGSLLPLLEKAPGTARIVNLSSTAHLFAQKADLQGDIMAPDRYTQWGAYCQSKLANVLFAKELNRRLQAANRKITVVACHPGGVATDLQRWVVADGDAQAARNMMDSPLAGFFRNLWARPLDLGANTQVYLAAGLDGGYDRSGGRYFDNMAPGLENPVASDEEVARYLWDESEKLTGVKIVV